MEITTEQVQQIRDNIGVIADSMVDITSPCSNRASNSLESLDQASAVLAKLIPNAQFILQSCKSMQAILHDVAE